MSTYNLTTSRRIVETIFGPAQVTDRICKVQMILYQIDKGIMWTARHTVVSPKGELPAETLARVFASYSGKGTLRQL
ncbi:MAG: hypothetical protein COX91_02230 [Candidatus Nealsonbacteria bacterium CG_4_10_14_0_2_um_filter_39_15]|uniref:Uncharacterized protein n=1 Tax=Candidatus Nealsonbacteria bacterium CG_4_10_14_0_2_um_filter_39_15 TaxID=1974681 RepID=A0A2M7UVP4_9BACT|nr:MAG: hypothetical protein COX91_02230 [Candidatus Nealsonbacteria bacterium CG_4_10_14_0_2_um_filter_39_15]